MRPETAAEMNGESSVFPHDERTLGIGMTLREYFAGLAMQGILAQGRFDGQYPETGTAKAAVRAADALLKALAAK